MEQVGRDLLLKDTIEAFFDDFFRLEITGGLMFGPGSWDEQEKMVIAASFKHIYSRLEKVSNAESLSVKEVSSILAEKIIDAWHLRFTTAQPLPYAHKALELVGPENPLGLGEDERMGLTLLFRACVEGLQTKTPEH